MMLFGIAEGVSEELDGVTESEDSPPRLLSELGVLPSSGVLLELGATEELDGSTDELDGATELEDSCSGVLSGTSDLSSSSFSSSS